MDWSDDALVLQVRRHGESGAILEALTRGHGRHLGLVHGGGSRRNRAVLQSGNTVRVHWRARLSEHLGNYAVEPMKSRAGTLMDDRAALAGLNAFASVASLALPEREPHAPVFAAAEILLDAMAGESWEHWGPLYVRWEAGLLEALGFGLDLSQCASTGATGDLLYVSPRTGRAVSRQAGHAYRDRLFALPGFLLGSQNAKPSRADIAAGLRLTGHFLQERVLRPHDRDLPPARRRLDEMARESK